jgi:dipeptidyl aminopeptidase/acylaminoacyl peptidase
MRSIKISVLFLALSICGFSQENLTYQKPSAEILQLADFQRTPSVSMNSKKDWMVFSYRPTYKTLDDLNQEEMKLAGLRVNPVTNISSSVTYISNLKVRKFNEKQETQVIGLPQNAKMTNLSWSPDEKKLAFTNTTDKGVELWILDLETRTAKKISNDNLNANLGSPFVWLKNSQELIVRKLPANRPALLNEKKNLPTGPIVSNADGKVSQNRTYQDLLKNPMDEANFETLTRAELVKMNLDGAETPYKSADIYAGIQLSPDGNYVMISTIKKPFSYIVPLSRFPMTAQVFDLQGNLVKTVNDVPLNEIMPKGFSSVRTGKRNMSWRADKPASLYFVEALDGGDQSKKAEFRDEIFTWDAPFSAEPKSLMKTKQRFAGIQFGNEENAIVMDSWYDTRSQKTYLLNPKTGENKEIADRNYQDVYADPGNFQTDKNEFGQYVISIKNGKAHLIGDGFTKDGQFPFIDKFDLKTSKPKDYTLLKHQM